MLRVRKQSLIDSLDFVTTICLVLAAEGIIAGNITLAIIALLAATPNYALKSSIVISNAQYVTITKVGILWNIGLISLSVLAAIA